MATHPLPDWLQWLVAPAAGFHNVSAVEEKKPTECV